MENGHTTLGKQGKKVLYYLIHKLVMSSSFFLSFDRYVLDNIWTARKVFYRVYFKFGVIDIYGTIP
jgi:hypothetical protein